MVGTWQNNALKRLDRRGPSETCPARFDQSTAVFLASCCLGFLYSRRFHVIFMRRWDELQGIVVASIIGQHVQGKGKRRKGRGRQPQPEETHNSGLSDYFMSSALLGDLW